MSMSTKYVIDRLDEATRVNRDAKQVCNDALSLARGRIQNLQIDMEWKDTRIKDMEGIIKAKVEEIKKLQAEVADLKARETVEGNCDILQDSSGNISIKCSSGSGEDRWIPCSERLPERSKDVLIKIKSTLLGCSWFAPRTGYCVESDGLDTHEWFVFGDPGCANPLPIGYKVVAWQPLPEDYVEPEVEESVEEEVKFEPGDFVVCISDGGNKIHAIYTGEDKDVYWVLDKHTFCPQNISKKYWHLKKCDKYVSAMEWLLTKED